MKRLQGNVLTIQTMMTCTCHLYEPAAISFYGWRYQVRHYCTYADGLKYLFRLRALLFTLQLKLLHHGVSFWEKNYTNAFKQVLCKPWFMYYLYSSKSFGKYRFRKYVYLLLSKKLNVTASLRKKQTGSFKIKCDKNITLKYIFTSIFCLPFFRWSTKSFLTF